MGLPQIMIDFSSVGASAVRRSARGNVALIVGGSGEGLVFKSASAAAAASGLTPDDKLALQLCFLGYPAKVTLIHAGEGEDIPKALQEAALASRGGWMCAPGLSAQTLVGFVKEQRAARNPVRGVVASAAAPDCEGIVNLSADGISVLLDDETAAVSPELYACRIAGTLAGLSLDRSATYLALPEVTAFDESDDPDGDIDGGKLILCRGGEGVRLGRAVTSLTSVLTGMSAELKKIKVAEAVDMIKSDIRDTFEKDYIGKIINDYDSKLLLVTAINGYLASLMGNVLDRSYDNRAFVDMEAQARYLMQHGIDTEGMSETDILTANTGSAVFLGAQVRFVDAMEDLTFSVVM